MRAPAWSCSRRSSSAWAASLRFTPRMRAIMVSRLRRTSGCAARPETAAVADSLRRVLRAEVSFSMVKWAERKFLRRSSLGSRRRGWSCIGGVSQGTGHGLGWAGLNEAITSVGEGGTTHEEEVVIVTNGGVLEVRHGEDGWMDDS